VAHPYSTAARLKRYLAGKGERYLTLLDRNFDGIADTDGTQSIENDVLERAANDVDADLGGVYSVPFATVSPTLPASALTYGQVGDLCDIRCAALLWSWFDPQSSDAQAALEEYKEAVGLYRSGERVIPGAAKVTAGEGRRSFAYESAGTEYAGGVTSGYRNVPYGTADSGDTVDPTRNL
jgi:phage gp36-like protein